MHVALDNRIGHCYYRARFYAAQLGRFVGRDPIGVREDVDLYRYVRSNPVVHLDPSGLGVFHCRCRRSAIAGAPGPGFGGWAGYVYTSVFASGPDANSACSAACRALGCGWEYVSTNPISDMQQRLSEFCGPNPTPACQGMVARIFNSIDCANNSACLWYATPIGWFCGPGGYCHDWSIKFDDAVNFHAKDKDSCLNVKEYRLDLNLWRTGYADHSIHVVKNVCTGKCLIIQNAWASGGQIVDPCDVGYSPGDFEGDGWATWQSILESCGCSR